MMSQKRMITIGHRQAFCWMDDWVDMIADIREMEEKTRKELDENRERGKELRGTTVSEKTG